MRASDLNPHERRVLFGLLAHLTLADDRIRTNELEELEEIGRELGVDPHDSIDEARTWFATVDDLLEAASTVRAAVRPLMTTLLVDLANADDDRAGPEDRLLDRVRAVWAPTR